MHLDQEHPLRFFSLGRFLHGILRDLMPWHKEESKYIQGNKDKNRWLSGFTRGRREKKVVNQEDIYEWEKFKGLLRKWHMKLSGVCDN